jgi:hypothetical protein
MYLDVHMRQRECQQRDATLYICMLLDFNLHNLEDYIPKPMFVGIAKLFLISR